MKNLECPSIGSYAVAGICGYFARCLQTEKGVEAEVDFCPDGQVYIVNRYVSIPQKTNYCFTTNSFRNPDVRTRKDMMTALKRLVLLSISQEMVLYCRSRIA